MSDETKSVDLSKDAEKILELVEKLDSTYNRAIKDFLIGYIQSWIDELPED